MGKASTSYAADSNLNIQDNSTNVENVKFDVYLDVNDRSKKQIEKDINAEDLNLYVTVSVQGGGYLSSGEIELENCNFKLKENADENKLKLDSIQSERGITIELPIKAVKEEEFNLGLLSMLSQIKLRGKYINNEGKSIEIEETKEVKISWTGDNITEENNPIELSQEIITNRMYNIEGENKRVVQVLVKSGIINNQYPIKATEIEVEVPKMGGEYPEEVIVGGYETKATNGKGSSKFGKEEENKEGKWTYNEAEKKVKIKVDNKVGENNEIKWTKEGKDVFVVTYVYGENVDRANFESIINSKISLYETKNTELTKMTEIRKEVVEEKGEAIGVNIGATGVVYKSNMKIGEETAYETNWGLEVGYSKVGKTIGMTNGGDKVVIRGEEKEADTYYKRTYINKEDFIKIFGEEGRITLAYVNKEGTIVEVGELNGGSQTDEKGNIYIEYEEKIGTLLIATSSAKTEGKVEIRHEKGIRTEGYNKEEIKGIEEIKTEVILSVSKDENSEEEIISSRKEVGIKVEEPKTEVEIGIDKTKLTTTQNNNINITATLKTNDLRYDLYTNPVIEIELPEEIEKAEIKDINLLNGNGLEIKNREITTNGNGNKVIRIEIEGDQKEYIGQDTQILINVDLQTKKLIPTIEKEIIMKCVNGRETIYENQEVGAATDSKKITLVAEQGILLANSVSKYNGEEPEIISFKNEEKTGLLNASSEEGTVVEAKGTIINNTGDKVENISVIGKINNNSNIKAIMKTGINVQNGKVYYTKDEEVTADSTWIEEYTEEVKGYKIEIASIENGQTIDFMHNIGLPDNLGTNKEMRLEYIVYNGQNKIESPTILLQTEQEVKLALEVVPTIKDGEVVYEGNTLTYNIKVTNTGETVARNIEINNPVPEGTALLEGNESSWKIDELKAGESQTKNVKVEVNPLAENETEKIITNITTVSASYLQERLTNIIINKAVKAVFHVENADSFQNELYEGDIAPHKVQITNVSGQTLKNVVVKRQIPEGMTYDSVGIGHEKPLIKTTWDEINKLAIYEIGDLEPNEKVVLNLKAYINKLEENVNSKNIVYGIDIEYDNGLKVQSKVDGGYIVKPNFISNFIATPKEFKVGEEVTYELTLKNNNPVPTSTNIGINIPEGLIIKNVKVLIDDEIIKEQTVDGQYVFNRVTIGGNQTLKIQITADVTDSFDKGEELEASATVMVRGNNFGGLEEEDRLIFEDVIKATNEIVDVPDNPDPDNPEKPDNPDPDDPDNPDVPDKPGEEEVYKIAGIAWLDEDENGEQEGNEKLLKGILVKIKDAETKEYLKDENGEELTAITDENGLYEFEGLKPGKYVVEFEYNKNTYKLTPIKGKDSVANIVTTGENTVITTDTITIKTEDISNINIGLCLNPIYDLRLDKYVTKITVQNLAGTTVYNYDKEQLAKVDIRAKQLAGTTVIIEYTIEVTNDGAVPGYAKTIADYLSPELKFNSELNTSWYQGTDNNLYCVELANDIIEPGESKQVKLVLTKTMTQNNTGLVNNTAEIYEDFNEYALEDINSVPGNKEKEENDMSGADVIITVSTGGAILYIGIIIGTMLILGGGIFIINKKVLSKEDMGKERM